MKVNLDARAGGVNSTAPTEMGRPKPQPTRGTNASETHKHTQTQARPDKGKIDMDTLTPSTVRTRVSDIKALAHLLRQGELLKLREPQKLNLRPI